MRGVARRRVLWAGQSQCGEGLRVSPGQIPQIRSKLVLNFYAKLTFRTRIFLFCFLRTLTGQGGLLRPQSANRNLPEQSRWCPFGPDADSSQIHLGLKSISPFPSDIQMTAIPLPITPATDRPSEPGNNYHRPASSHRTNSFQLNAL